MKNKEAPHMTGLKGEKHSSTSLELAEITETLKNLKFKKKTLFGVDEADVWKKLDMLNKKYEQAYIKQEVRNKAKLDEKDERIKTLEFRLYSLLGNRGRTK